MTLPVMCGGRDCWNAATDRGFCPVHAPMLDITCRWCDRYCPRCRYFIPGGSEHIEQVQPKGGSHFVCSYKGPPISGQMVPVIREYLDHAEHRLKVVPQP